MPAAHPSLLAVLRRLAKQREPAAVSEAAAPLTRLLARMSALTVEQRAHGFVLRFAGDGQGDSTGPLAVTCFVHRLPDVKLTPAESAVARGLCAGRTLAQIARLRGVSPNTVKSQVRQIFRKLDVDSRLELVGLLGP